MVSPGLRPNTGEFTEEYILREWREQVELHPEIGGLGSVLHDMHDACRGKDYKKISFHNREGGFLYRWCFKRVADADEFHARFGGRRLSLRGLYTYVAP